MENRARGGGSSRTPAQDVKVKHVITRNVSTDEASFKDVVLRLTGKDSAAARMELLRATAPVVSVIGGSSRSNVVAVEGSRGAGFIMGTPVPLQDTVLPSLEEMERWWGSHDNIDAYARRP